MRSVDSSGRLIDEGETTLRLILDLMVTGKERHITLKCSPEHQARLLLLAIPTHQFLADFPRVIEVVGAWNGKDTFLVSSSEDLSDDQGRPVPAEWSQILESTMSLYGKAVGLQDPALARGQLLAVERLCETIQHHSHTPSVLTKAYHLGGLARGTLIDLGPTRE